MYVYRNDGVVPCITISIYTITDGSRSEMVMYTVYSVVSASFNSLNFCGFLNLSETMTVNYQILHIRIL